MKNFLYLILWFTSSLSYSFADWWILWEFRWDETEKAIRTWDIHITDIPVMLKSVIDFWLSIAWTIAVIFVIVWAYKILFGSLEQDKTKWKDTIIMALGWFAIASLAWFIVKLIIDNLA